VAADFVSAHLQDLEQRLRKIEEGQSAMYNMARGAFAVVGVLITLLGYLFFDMRSELSTKVDYANRQDLIENYRRDISEIQHAMLAHEHRDELRDQRIEKHFEASDAKIERLLTGPPWPSGKR
jgi:hypothetical protein